MTLTSTRVTLKHHSSGSIPFWNKKFKGSIILVLLKLWVLDLYGTDAGQCIDSKIGMPCATNTDCASYDETHLYCNQTGGSNVCAFTIDTYGAEVREDLDCPGDEFKAADWSNPISDSVLHNATGADCLRYCLLTETCFGVVVKDHKCFLKNEKCMIKLSPEKGAIIAVIALVREDYHCGCHYPFRRTRSNGQVLSWSSYCPEAEGNPYRCCSPQGLCAKCAPGESPQNAGSSSSFLTTFTTSPNP